MAKKPKKQRPEYPSTYVSSPVRAPKQKIRQYAYNQADDDDDEEEDYYAEPRHPTRNQRVRGYNADDFAANDSDMGEFAPVRIAKPARITKTKSLGVPITTDQRLAGLTDTQLALLEDFMNGARNLRESIMREKGHRHAIFTDTVLREMGLDLPMNLEEMRALPGIRSEMVDLYGKKFLKLVRNSREFYGDNAPRRKHLPGLRAPIVHEVSDDDDDDDDEYGQPEDPNHRVVVDLCGSDDDDLPAALDDESNYSYDDDDEDDAVHTSHHFTQHIDPEVEEYRRTMTQLQASTSASTAKAPVSKTDSKATAAGYKKGRFSRKSGSFGKPAGVRKRATGKASSSRTSGGAGPARKPTGGGSRKGGGSGAGGNQVGGWASIMAMPT